MHDGDEDEERRRADQARDQDFFERSRMRKNIRTGAPSDRELS